MKQLIQAASSPIKARVAIPGSKSITNRALLLAALADGVSTISDMLLSEDTLAFVQALQQLGVVVELDSVSRACRIVGCGGQFPKNAASIWCADAGTVARFLVAACATSSGSYYVDASVQLRNRPIDALLRVLEQQGALVLPEHADKMPFTINGRGKLRGGLIEIEGVKTSQFLSALLMVAPFAHEAVLLKSQDLVSSPYVDMTCAMMADFGVLVRHLHGAQFSVAVPQAYRAVDYCVEPDFSTASYFFAAAAVTNGEVIIQSVDRARSKQGDVAFLTVLEKMGCQVMTNQAGLKVAGAPVLEGVGVDMKHFSDTFMTLAAIAPFAATPTTITNIGHTRHQESDRIAAMRTNLEKLQIKVEEGSDWIKIYPGKPQATQLQSYQDHRIAMACSIIGLRVPGIEIDGAECVAKTCPDFFTLWRNLIS